MVLSLFTLPCVIFPFPSFVRWVPPGYFTTVGKGLRDFLNLSSTFFSLPLRVSSLTFCLFSFPFLYYRSVNFPFPVTRCGTIHRQRNQPPPAAHSVSFSFFFLFPFIYWIGAEAFGIFFFWVALPLQLRERHKKLGALVQKGFFFFLCRAMYNWSCVAHQLFVLTCCILLPSQDLIPQPVTFHLLFSGFSCFQQFLFWHFSCHIPRLQDFIRSIRSESLSCYLSHCSLCVWLPAIATHVFPFGPPSRHFLHSSAGLPSGLCSPTFWLKLFSVLLDGKSDQLHFVKSLDAPTYLVLPPLFFSLPFLFILEVLGDNFYQKVPPFKMWFRPIWYIAFFPRMPCPTGFRKLRKVCFPIAPARVVYHCWLSPSPKLDQRVFFCRCALIWHRVVAACPLFVFYFFLRS